MRGRFFCECMSMVASSLSAGSLPYLRRSSGGRKEAGDVADLDDEGWDGEFPPAFERLGACVAGKVLELRAVSGHRFLPKQGLLPG
jgi:hypothetical protein